MKPSFAHHHARKRFGQHFLRDSAVIDRIVRAIGAESGQHLVEIGPGRMALTQALLEGVDRLTVIELDRDLAAQLRKVPQLEVVEADVLKVDFAQLQKNAQPLRIVGNLPYNISSPILFHLSRFAACIQDQHFMLQKEVVDRMLASPCTAAYGRLSVALQCRYEMEHLLDVPAQAFDPPPQVMSAVLRMRPIAWPVGVDARVLEELVQVAFSQRRKLLRHSLGRWLEAQNAQVSFDTQRRAEEVPVDEYVALARQLSPPPAFAPGAPSVQAQATASQ